MEIGLDYMQIRTQAQYHGLRWVGMGLLLVGIALIVIGLAYYGNLLWLRSNVDNYAAQRNDVVQLPASQTPSVVGEGEVVSALALPPGTYAEDVSRLGFTPLGPSDAHPLGTLPQAKRVIVPELGINVRTSQAGLTGPSVLDAAKSGGRNDLGVVEANPGERGALWFFGEAGEGANHFGGLEDAAPLLLEGEDILIFVDNGDNVFLYAGTHTDVFPTADLRLSGTDRSTIHLTVPVPSGLYDHFLVLSGELVGFK